MNRADWFKRLDQMIDEPVEPVCPSFCCFTYMCPTWLQQGTNRLFVSTQYTNRRDCIWYQQLAPFARGTFGMEPPATAEELLEMVVERSAIREEAS